MNNDNLLKYLSWVSNRSHNQTLQLFELCGNNFEKLMELEAKTKKHHLFGCPADKTEVNNRLKLEL